MRVSFKPGSLFRLLFGASRRESYLAEYVLREHARGRALRDVLDDPYVRNRATHPERMRLLDRPELVAAIGEQAVGGETESTCAGR